MNDSKIVVQVKIKVQERKFPMSFDVTLTTPKESHELDLSILNDKSVKVNFIINSFFNFTMKKSNLFLIVLILSIVIKK